MIVVTQPHATEQEIEGIIQFLTEHGFDIHRSTGVQHTVIGAIGVQPDFDHRQVELLSGVAEVVRISDPYKLASRAFRNEGTLIKLGRVQLGGDPVVVMAGPCAVESE